ncbi:unnamed protein product [Clavelina lepadiformis]|uniref:HEAT repeat-containing protein 5B n=1 Tax=Clavelina lepadiformis TaxID=159417 RepID=A0ABP0GMF1_CLALP
MSHRSDIKEKQKQLVAQLNAQILAGPGPPTRSLIGYCLSTLYQVGDSYSMYETVSKCNEIVRNKDDSPSYLSIRLAAIVAIGILYEENGRMLGALFTDTVQVLVKGLKNAESQTRCETMTALRRLLVGLGASATMCHRDIYKVAKLALVDRSMFVRTSAAQCLEELIKESAYVYMNEFEPLIQQAVRALDGSTYEVRCAVAKMLGTLAAGTQKPKPAVTKGKKPSFDDAMGFLANGYLQAGSWGGARDLLKGSASSMSIRNVRIGVTEAYVEFVRELGSDWLETNMTRFINKVLEIAVHPKATTNHVEAVYTRRCISFIFRSTIGIMLGEAQQQVAVRELCNIVSKHTAIIDVMANDGTNGNNTSTDVMLSQHVLICATQEIGSLLRSLGTSASPLVAEKQTSIVDPILGVLLYPSQATRLSAAWCLRCIATALPAQLSLLIDLCVEKMESLKASGEALSGYSAALSALLGAVKDCPMGISHAKGNKIFNVAEKILRSVGQNTKISIFRTQSGWLLIGALMTLGPSVVNSFLPKLILMWKTSFPRSMRELEQEKQRGDPFTWQLALEARAGSLCAMRSFVAHCGPLLTEETKRKIMIPLESAMAMMGLIPEVIAIHGPHLKAGAAMLRLRLYDILALLPPSVYEGSFSALLRELVAEFTLTDNPANTTTSLLRSLCHQDDSALLGSWLRETDQSLVEVQLQGHSASGSGSIEHDATTIYLQSPQENVAPGPLPLGVSVIDAAIALFGLAFPHVAMKHRLQMLKHFDDCVKQAAKNAQRQRAIQINVFTALICALKGLGESKRHLGGNEVRSAASELILSALTSSDITLRCAAGEAVGRMAQVTNNPTYVAKTAQLCFEKLKTARDVISRTGHSLALGCLHRYVGGMGSGQHLRMSVGILLALSQDSNSPEVQVWALHALSLIVDAFGPMFRSFVDSTLHVVLTLFLQVAPHHMQVHRCLSRCLGALVTTLGPELQGNATAITTARSSCLTCCAIMSHHADVQVQSESVSCLQQLHMFAPRHVELSTLVPRLCCYLSSWHLILRRSAVSCLRQLAQKEAQEVCEIASRCSKPNCNEKFGVTIGDTGLEGALFSILDKEVDMKLTSDTRDTLSHIFQALALNKLSFWVALCKSVLAASTDTVTLSTVDQQQQETGDDKDANDDDTFTARKKDSKPKNVILPRWPTRVFAVDLIRRVIAMCRQSDANPAHFDLASARNIVRSGKKGEFLVLHLSDLVRLAFMASTDNCTQLRMAGLEALQDIIKYFKDVPEPEFHGSVILEQYQANVGAALRPAFSATDAPHEVTVRACEVCSAWISSGVVSDLSDLRRVHALLVSSLEKIKEVNSENSSSRPDHSESASTMEKLAVLKAWAEVYIGSVENKPAKKEAKSSKENLLSLVEPHLTVLANLWLKALKDQAILKLPPELIGHLPTPDGSFFTMETMSSVRSHYSYAWPTIMHALALWLAHVDFQDDGQDEEDAKIKLVQEERRKRLHLVMGVCVEALCSPRTSESISVIVSCLSTLDALLSSAWTRKTIGNDQVLGVEILNVLHRLLLTRDSYPSQQIVLSVVKKIVQAAKFHLHRDGEFTEVQELGEGGENGELITGQSTVFAVLEVCMCVLVRQMPSINPTFRSTSQEQISTNKNLTQQGAQLVSTATHLLGEVLSLCSERGSLTVLPTLLFLLVGVVREGTSRSNASQPSYVTVTAAALQTLQSIMTSPFLKTEKFIREWNQLLQSALVSVLELAKEDAYDVISLMACVALFLLQAPSSVCNTPKLLVKILEFFAMCFNSNDAKIKLKCLTHLSRIFRHPEALLSRSFIHKMAPLIVQYLDTEQQEMTSDDVPVVIEALSLVEQLVLLTEEVHRDEMAGMLIPLLISKLLVDPRKADTNGNRSAPKVSLHQHCLQRLLQIGPKYPQAFKSSLASNPQYKLSLEAAIRQNQAKIQHQQQQRAAVASVTKKAQAQPSIALKMDFSNFGKK